MVTKPRSETYVLHILHGHLVGFHFRIFVVNFDNENFFMSLGTIDQILGPRWVNVSVPQETVDIEGFENAFSRVNIPGI